MRKAAIDSSLPALAILFGIVVGNADARGDAVPSADAPEAPIAETKYFAIMGEVARPGVFEAIEPRMQLLELVRRAGGATPMASGNVRIIRSGRAGEQTYLTQGLAYTLLANDLVILDAWQSQTRPPYHENPNARPGEHDPNGWPGTASSVIVQLGLVNLLTRPIVLDVNPGEATLGTILSLLHQPTRNIRTVTIIHPPGGAGSMFGNETVESRLVSGSVLVFESTMVDTSVLPPLPATVPAVPMIAPPAPVTAVPRESIPQALRRMQTAAKRETPEPAGPAQSTRDAPQGRVVAKEKSEPRHPPRRVTRAGQPAGEEIHPASSHAGLFLLVAAVAPGLALFALKRWRSKRRRQPEMPEEFTAELTGVEPLQSLIANAFPVVEEPFVLPTKQEIFGRPRLDSPYRIDTAHGLSGPHFPIEPARPRFDDWEELPARREIPHAAPRPEIEELRAACHSERVETAPAPLPAAPHDAAEAAEVDGTARRIRIDRAHPRSSLGALDRALATFEEGRS